MFRKLLSIVSYGFEGFRVRGFKGNKIERNKKGILKLFPTTLDPLNP